MRPWLIVVAMAGCNQVFGIRNTDLLDGDVRPDLDHDGVADAVDPCIAGMADGDEDYDGDSIPNRDDGCPAIDPNGPDSDGDGVPDACDPFPMLAGDRHRCTMRFLSADLNEALWHTRDGTLPWTLTKPGGLNSALTAGAIVATESIEAPATTAFDVHVVISIDTGGANELGLWLRAGDAPSPSDVGCELVGTSTTFHLELHGAGVTMSSPTSGIPSGDGTAQMTAVLAPGSSGANLRCYAVIFWTDPSTGDGHARSFGPVAAAVALPAGHVALSNAGLTGVVDVLTIYDRDDAPPLP